MQQLLSPKQVATSIGVSESSLKRWCDQGAIRTERTPGGHRKIRVGAVVDFLREHRRQLVRPEILGLPAAAGRVRQSHTPATDLLRGALEQGDAHVARQVVLDAYLGGTSVVDVCEQLLAPVLRAIGERWECGDVEVFQEHRACEIVNRSLYELRSLLREPEASAPLAIGGSAEGELYRLPSLMIELVLIDAGWRATMLGNSLPYSTLKAAAAQHRPALFWLSFSYLGDEGIEKERLISLGESLPAETRLALGGRAIEEAFTADIPRAFYCGDFYCLREQAVRLNGAATTS